MRLMSTPARRALACAAGLAAALLSGHAKAAPVTFPGDGLELKGELIRPSGKGPFPAVVALHGCSGLYGRDGKLSPRHRAWADKLAASGFVVLFPDSFGSRGAPAQCKTEDRVTRPAHERVDDALAAKAFLQQRADVRAGAVSLLGWSNGGSTVLYAVSTHRGAEDGRPGFVRAVAFYPGCRLPLERESWHAHWPLLILIGAADDWTPAAPCEALVARARAAGEPVAVITYPDAFHDFDAPDTPVHEVSGVAFSANGDGLVHTGTNAAARADAIRRVAAFLGG